MSGFVFGEFSAAFTTSGSQAEGQAQNQTQTNPNVDYGILPIGYKLNGQNYNLWSHAILIFIGREGKEENLFQLFYTTT